MARYNPEKQEQAWQKEKRDYTQCAYYRMCHYSRPVELCLDVPDTCPVKFNLHQELADLVEQFPEGKQ